MYSAKTNRKVISIHALTRRAASFPYGFDNKQGISIHALTRRAAATYSM